MPDWQNVPENWSDYYEWLKNTYNWENMMKELDELNDGTAEELDYDFNKLNLKEAETLWDFGEL